MLQYNPSISGSLSVTGSLIVTNGVIGTVSGVDVQIFSSSINQVITGIQSTTGSQDGRLTSIESFTSSTSARLNSIETISASNISRIGSLEIISASNVARIGNIETFTSSTTARLNSIETISASNIARLNSLETKSASVDTTNTTQNTRLTNLENKTGSLATTGSNTFYGTQIISGTTYIAGDFVVQGSSSIQYISASSVSIGTNIVNLNTANPAVRYGGISVQDSGSANGVTGSMLWDSTCNRWIYSNPSGVGYSGGVIMSGPRAATFGTETTLTCNYIAKSGGGDHLYDSCVWEMSGSMGINTSSPAVTLHVDASGGGIIRATRLGSGAGYIQLEADGTNGTLSSSNGLLINTGGNQRVNITSTGIACFSSNICVAEKIIVKNGGNSVFAWADDASAQPGSHTVGCISSGTTELYSKIYMNVNAGLFGQSTQCMAFIGTAGACNRGLLFGTVNTAPIFIGTSNSNRIQIESSGITTFACQICAPTMQSTYFSGTCLTLSGFSSGNGFKMDYGSASGQITAINLMANGTTNGFIGIQMVDGSNGDLWLGSSANRSMTIYRTGNVGFNTNNPCTRIHAEGGYGARFGCGYCFYGGGISGGQFPYGDIYGNGASYTYQVANTTATNTDLFGGYAAGYFRGGNGGNYGGGGAGIVAIGGDGGNAESVNAGGGAGIFARGGKNGAASAHSYAGWFDGGDVMIRCGNAYFCGSTYGILGLGTKVHDGTYHVFTGASCVLTLPINYGSASSIYLFGSLLGNDSMHYAHMMYYYRNDYLGFMGSTITQMSCYNPSTAGQRYTFSIVDPGGTGKSGCPIKINITCANGPDVGAGSYCTRFKIVVYNVY